MLDIEYLAAVEGRIRHEITYPRADLLGAHERLLQLRVSKRKRTHPVPATWAGNGLVAIGRRLTALGERLAPPCADRAQPSA